MNELRELDEEVCELLENALDEERARRALNYYFYDEGSVLSLLEFGISESIRKNDLNIYSTIEKSFDNECYSKYSTIFGFVKFCVLSGMLQQFFKIEQLPRKGKKHLYVILMSNQTVKIGIAHDVGRRYSQIKASSGMEIVNHWESGLLEDACVMEAKLHKEYKKFRLKGEFFVVDYDKAVKRAKQITMIG